MSQPELTEADYLAALPDGVAGYLAGAQLRRRIEDALGYATGAGHPAMHSRLLVARAQIAGYLADFETDRKPLGRES